jgi:hypothetical protein
MSARNEPRTASAKKPAAAAPAEIGAQLTTAPVQPADVAGVEPEFVRLADLQRLFGIKRGHAYQLMHDGAIQSVCLRRRGHKRGVRLVSVASVREYLKRQSEQPAFVWKGNGGEAGAA